MHSVISFLFQYSIPTLIIFVFSFGTVVYLLRKYFQKRKMGSELMISLRLVLIFIIFITSNTIFKLYANKSIFKFIYHGEDPCYNYTNNSTQFIVFMLTITFHPIIYFWFSRVFWKRFYTHIVQRWRGTGRATVRGEVIPMTNMTRTSSTQSS